MKRTCLVTGATAGLGRAPAQALAELGGPRVILLARDPGKARETQRAIGGDSHVVIADLTDQPSLQQAADKVLTAFDALHVLIRNARVSPLTRGVDAYEVEFGFRPATRAISR